MRYEVWDVFTDRAFGGNPLAVVWPDGAACDMPAIAREFNFSETVFLLPPEAGGDMRVRIFTPAMELPFAGHPTIGTACALAARGMGPDMVLELGVGPISATARDGAARFTTEVPLNVASHFDAAEIAACVGLPPEAVTAPCPLADLGTPFVFAQLRSADDLAACQPDLAAFRRTRGEAGRLGVFAWVRDGSEIQARMFAPLGGIPEDPATGSASATLGALLAAEEGEVELTIRQGEAMGRPSRIGVRARPGSVTVSGSAVKVMEGRLCL